MIAPHIRKRTKGAKRSTHTKKELRCDSDTFILPLSQLGHKIVEQRKVVLFWSALSD